MTNLTILILYFIYLKYLNIIIKYYYILFQLKINDKRRLKSFLVNDFHIRNDFNSLSRQSLDKKLISPLTRSQSYLDLAPKLFKNQHHVLFASTKHLPLLKTSDNQTNSLSFENPDLVIPINHVSALLLLLLLCLKLSVFQKYF